MKYIIVLIAVASLSAHATLFSVAKDGVSMFEEVQPAINTASAGDTIFIAASGATYAGFTVDRHLVIIGTGSDTLIGASTKIGSEVSVSGSGASGTELQSLHLVFNAYNGGGSYESSACVLRLLSGVQDVYISHCVIENTTTSAHPRGCLWVDNTVSARLYNSVFMYSGNQQAGNDYGVMLGGAPDLQITNCVFSGLHDGINGGTSSAFLTVRHCLFDNAWGIKDVSGYGSVENSYFRYEGQTNSPNIVIAFCADGNSIPYGEGNIMAPYTDFVDFDDHNPWTSDYHVTPGSALVNAGDQASPPDQDGSRADIGIYGGQLPNRKFGFPDFPVVTKLEVPLLVPQNGVLRFGARGRIGPGN